MKCLLLAFHSSRHRRLCRATAPSFWHQYTYNWKAFSSNGLPVKSFCIHWNDFYQWHFGQYCARKAILSRTVKIGEILWHMLKSSKNIQPEVFPYGFKHATHNGNGQLLRIALPAGYVLSFMVAMLLQWSIFSVSCSTVAFLWGGCTRLQASARKKNHQQIVIYLS